MKSTEYHLPEGSYWCCSSTYNGLSQSARFNTSQSLRDVTRKQLRNLKISSRIAKQLN